MKKSSVIAFYTLLAFMVCEAIFFASHSFAAQTLPPDNTSNGTPATFTGEATLTVNDNQNISATDGVSINTTSNHAGTVTFSGASTVSGSVGTNSLYLNQINAGLDSKTVTFSSGNMYADTLRFSNTVTSGTVTFTGVIANTNVTTAGDGLGILTFSTTSNALHGNIGAEDGYLATVNAGTSGTVLRLYGSVYANNFNLTNTTSSGTAYFYDNVNYDAGGGAGITTAGNGFGILTLAGTSTINATVGTSANKLATVNAAANSEIDTFNGNIFATTLNMQNTTSSGTVTLADNVSYNNGITAGSITTAGNGFGILQCDGTSTVNSTVGTSSNALASVKGGADGETATFSSDIYATTLNVTGTGTAQLNGNLTSTVNFDSNTNNGGTCEIATGKTIDAVTTSNAGKGTVTFDGSTVTGGDLGTNTRSLFAVNFNGIGANSTLGHDIYALTTTANNSATVTLSGNRAIKGDATLAGTSTLDIGNSTLTLSDTGIYTQGAGTTLKLTANSATDFGKITASGNAVVSNTSIVNVTADSYIASGSQFTIIDGLGGAGVNVPGTITSSSSRVSFTGLSLNGDLILTASRSGGGYASDAPANSNAAAVGTVLDNIQNPTSDMFNVLNTLDTLSATQTYQALNTLIPQVDYSVLQVSYTTQEEFLQTVFTHTSSTGISTGSDMLKGLDIWSQGFGSYLHQDARDFSDGYNATIWGTAAGFDYSVAPDLKLGFSGGFAQDFIRSKDSSARNDINSYQGTIYTTYSKERFYINTAAAFAYNDYDSSRHIAVGAIDRTAKGDYDGQEYSGYVDTGYTFTLKKIYFTPLFSFQYSHLRINSYTETGANALNLNVDRQDYDLAQTGFGCKLGYSIKRKTYTITPEVKFKWLYDWIGDTQQSASTFTGGGASFNTQGFTPAQSSYEFGTKLTLVTDRNITLSLNYDLEVKEDFYGHYGYANVKYSF